MANGRAKGKNLRAAISLRSRATVISIHYTGRIAQVFFQKNRNFFECCTLAVPLRQPFSDAHELRSNTLFMGGSPFLGTLYMVQPSCVSDTPLPGWGFRRLQAAGTFAYAAGAKKGWTPTVSTPLLNLLLSLCS